MTRMRYRPGSVGAARYPGEVVDVPEPEVVEALLATGWWETAPDEAES